MIPDIFHLVIPIVALRKEALSNRPLHRDRTIRRDLCIMILTIALLFIVCSFL